MCHKRAKRISEARNKNLLMVDNKNIEYNFIIDTNIFFNYETTLKPLIDYINKHPDVVMACSNGIDIISGNYYDTLALNRGRYKNMNINIKKNEKIKTGFGGVAIIKNSVLFNCDYTINRTDICEHWNFCDKIRNYN